MQTLASAGIMDYGPAFFRGEEQFNILRKSDICTLLSSKHNALKKIDLVSLSIVIAP
jgi:hypothetical protein